MTTKRHPFLIQRYNPLVPLKGKVVFIKATVLSENLQDGTIVVSMPDYQELTHSGHVRLDYGDTFVYAKNPLDH